MKQGDNGEGDNVEGCRRKEKNKGLAEGEVKERENREGAVMRKGSRCE